jgi:hypothetical protein
MNDTVRIVLREHPLGDIAYTALADAVVAATQATGCYDNATRTLTLTGNKAMILARLREIGKPYAQAFEVLPDGAPSPRPETREPFTCPTCGRVFFNVTSCVACEGSWTFVPGAGVAVRRGTTLDGTDLLLERR